MFLVLILQPTATHSRLLGHICVTFDAALGLFVSPQLFNKQLMHQPSSNYFALEYASTLALLQRVIVKVREEGPAIASDVMGSQGHNITIVTVFDI